MKLMSMYTMTSTSNWRPLMTKIEKLIALLTDFDVEDKNGFFTAIFYTEGRVISFLEEEKCIEKIKKAGGEDIHSKRDIGICRFNFKMKD